MNHDRALLHPCVAHRGFSGKAPENTIAAFRMAMEIPSVQWIELDVHLSRDEVPVVIHDGTLKRTTNGQGEVRNYTAEQLGKLDAGSWFNPTFSGQSIPTLQEVIELTAGRCNLNIELKGTEDNRDLLAGEVVDVIHANSFEFEPLITSFHPELLSAVKNKDSTIRTGLITSEKIPDLINRLDDLGASFLSIEYRLLNPLLIQQCQEASIQIMAWTVNSEIDLRRLASRPEVFQLCTNFPDRWLEAVKEG